MSKAFAFLLRVWSNLMSVARLSPALPAFPLFQHLKLQNRVRRERSGEIAFMQYSQRRSSKCFRRRVSSDKDLSLCLCRHLIEQ